MVCGREINPSEAGTIVDRSGLSNPHEPGGSLEGKLEDVDTYKRKMKKDLVSNS